MMTGAKYITLTVEGPTQRDKSRKTWTEFVNDLYIKPSDGVGDGVEENDYRVTEVDLVDKNPDYHYVDWSEYRR